MTDTRPHPTLPRSLQPHAGAPEESTWSTRSAASMNDVDTDNRRHTIGNEEGPDHRHNAEIRTFCSAVVRLPALRRHPFHRNRTGAVRRSEPPTAGSTAPAHALCG